MAILPIELFDIIIDILKHDRPALKALALTHPRFTRRAQERIFAHIALSGEQSDTDNTDSILLALTHPKHTHLLAYIHALTLTNLIYFRSPTVIPDHVPNLLLSRSSSRRSDYVPNHLIPLFIDTIAPQLSSLVLRGFAPGGWNDGESTPLRSAITRVLASPKLTHLDFDGVNRFPITLLNHASTLTHFRFATPYASYTPVPGTTIVDAPKIYLDVLEISLWGENPPRLFIDWILGDSRLSVAGLRKLSINGTFTNQVAHSLWRLLDECHSTLRHLSLGPDNFSYESYNTLYNLRVLRTLQFKTELIYHERLIEPAPFSFLIYVLNNLPSSSILHQLDIQVRYTWRGDSARSYQSMDMSPWDTLASFILGEIQNGKFKQLECICVGVATIPASPDVVNPKNIFSMIKDKFATLLQSSTISIEFFEFA